MANGVTVPPNGFLHFAHALRLSDNQNLDGGVVECSSDGGATWN